MDDAASPVSFFFTVECERATPGKRGWNGRFRLISPVAGIVSLTRLPWEPKVGRRYVLQMSLVEDNA